MEGNNTWFTILSMIFTFIGGGTFTTIVAGFFNARKNKVDSTDVAVKTALEIEKIAMERYTSTNEKLIIVEQLLGEVKDELQAYKEYVDVLTDILDRNKIEYPEMSVNKK